MLKYGFRIIDGKLVPIITDNAVAPAFVLLNIRCACKSGNKLCTSKLCTKKGLSVVFTVSAVESVKMLK